MAIELARENQIYTIVSVYLPPDRERALQVLKEIEEEAPSWTNTILMGDFNCTESDDSQDVIGHPRKDTFRKELGETLQRLKWVDTESNLDPDELWYTHWNHDLTQGARIDRVYIQEESSLERERPYCPFIPHTGEKTPLPKRLCIPHS